MVERVSEIVMNAANRATQYAPRSTVPPAAPQPYQYRRTALVEPDWTRLPGWRQVTAGSGAAPSGSAHTA